MKEPVAARGNILLAAAADKAAPGSRVNHSGTGESSRAADAGHRASQSARSSSGPAHAGLHVSGASLKPVVGAV